MANRELIKAYEEVFDAQGNVRACGREACKKLIEACSRKKPDKNFGDKRTGQMNISEIKNLIEEINEEEKLLSLIN